MNSLNKLMKLSLPLLTGLLIVGNIHAENLDIEFDECNGCFSEDPMEYETFVYQAKMIAFAAAPKQDINKLAQEAVFTCYNAFQQYYSECIAQEKAELAGMGAGALNSSYAKLMPVKYGKSFATAIINQLDIIAQKLSPQDKNMFWNAAEQQIKQVLGNFCRGHGAASTNDLDNHISSQINLKKMFG